MAGQAREARPLRPAAWLPTRSALPVSGSTWRSLMPSTPWTRRLRCGAWCSSRNASSRCRADASGSGRRISSRLRDLYSLGGGEAFHPRQLEQGVFYGIKSGPRLVAVAGTHLVSRTYGVAAVGNVFTHPARRGCGYGAATTSAVTAELAALGIRDIILNVSQANTPAIRAYERLGFECYCPFLEAAGVKAPAAPMI